MFTYCPVGVTTHLSVSVNVFRWGKMCVMQQYVLCVLLPYSTSCVYTQLVALWFCSDGNVYWVLELGLLLLNSPFLPVVLSCITTPGILFVCWWSFKVLLHWFPLMFFYLLIFSAERSWFLIFWAAVSYVIYFCFIRLASFCRAYLVFLTSYSCTNLVSLYLP
jgi:hypothetical protein